MLLGYNTNGFAHHELLSAIELLHEIGYRSVAITLDHHALNPYSKDHARELQGVAGCLQARGLRSVVETGARFLLDPPHKHEPTLLTADPDLRQRRIDFLCRAIDVAEALGSDCVSLWSGVLRDDVAEETAWGRLLDAVLPVVEHATRRGVVLGFEPEPGMFIDTMPRFERLQSRVAADCLRLTLDVGHLHCLGEVPIPVYIQRWSDEIVNVHIEDMRSGVHEHLMFGEGEMDFDAILQAFEEIGYAGALHVELSRHSHAAPETARRAFDFLNSRLVQR